MKRNKGYSFFVFGILVICLSLGIYLGFRYTKNTTELEDYNQPTAEDVEVIKEDTTPVSTKTYDIEVIYIDEYIKCNHVIENKNVVYSTTLDKLKEEENNKQKESGNIYEVIEENNQKLVYSRKIEQNCPNHFLIKLEDNKVVIYNVVDESAMIVFKYLEVEIETLNPEMIEELNEGIKIESKEELNLIIEDIES